MIEKSDELCSGCNNRSEFKCLISSCGAAECDKNTSQFFGACVLILRKYLVQSSFFISLYLWPFTFKICVICLCMNICFYHTIEF